MPRIDDQPVETKRPFKKKAYRPWNLMDEEVPNLSKPEQQNDQHIAPQAEIVTIKESNSNHIDTIKESISNHMVIDLTEKVTICKPISNRISNPISNQKIEPTKTNRPDYYAGLSVNDLVNRVSGLQKKILFYIVENCILNGSLSSSPITNESLQLLVNTDKDTVKTALHRLINKKLFCRGFGKPGRGGFSIFHITEEVRNAVIDAQKHNHLNTELVTNWISKQEPISSYSSSSQINTTTREISNENTSPILSAWENVDIEPLHSIGFSKTHLKQIILDDKLSSEIVQDSIFAFAFDLENNNKQKSLKSAPLNYFMGILRSGTPYAPPANYESPQDKTMRVYLEHKKEMNLKRQAMEDELFQIAFNEWDAQLSPNEKDLILPASVKNSRLTAEKIAYVRSHFKENIWPSIKSEYLFSKK